MELLSSFFFFPSPSLCFSSKMTMFITENWDSDHGHACVKFHKLQKSFSGPLVVCLKSHLDLLSHNNKDVEEARYIEKDQIYRWLLAMLVPPAKWCVDLCWKIVVWKFQWQFLLVIYIYKISFDHIHVYKFFFKSQQRISLWNLSLMLN